MSPTVTGIAAGAVLAVVALAFGFWGLVLTALFMGIGAVLGRSAEGRLDLGGVLDALRGWSCGPAGASPSAATTRGAPVTVAVDLAVIYGHPLEQRAKDFRRQLAETLARQTELNITAIDITITDILEPRSDRGQPPTNPEEKQ